MAESTGPNQGKPAFPDDADDWTAPDKHEKISDKTLGFLTVTEDGELHWKGKQVQIKQESRIVFGFLSGLLASAVAVSTITIGLLSLNQEFCFLAAGKSCSVEEPEPETARTTCQVMIGDEGDLEVVCPTTAIAN